MKDFCLKVALLLFLGNSTLYAQQYLPVLEEGKQWVVNRSVTDINNNITFEASGDSVLNVARGVCRYDRGKWHIS